MGIGHVRYPTAGTASASEAQPFFVNSPLGIYLIHNGNVTNTDELRAKLNSSQSFFNRHLRTDSDSEVWLDLHYVRTCCLQTLLGSDIRHSKVVPLQSSGETCCAQQPRS